MKTKLYVHVANAVQTHKLATDDWEYVPVHILLPASTSLHLPLIT